MRNKSHSNRWKRIRKGIEEQLRLAGIPFANVLDKQLVLLTVKSKSHYVSIKRELSADFPSLEDWDLPVQTLLNTSLRWINDPLSPRGIYLRVKQRVSAARRDKRSRVLRVVRDRAVPGGMADRLRGVEHAGAEGIQPQHDTVPGLQGLGVSDSAQG